MFYYSKTVIIHLTIILSLPVFASSNRTPPPRLSSTPTSYAPNTRTAKEIEKDIYSWPKNGVSIHKIEVRGNIVIITGTYYQKEKIEKFLKKLRGEDSSVTREVSLNESIMPRYIDFIAEVENKW